MAVKNLNEISTKAPNDFYLDKDDAQKKVDKLAEKISEKLTILNAQKKYSILVIFQGMDGSGKDGSTKALFNEASPINVSITSYKKPTEEEFAHDFLWRCHKVAPAKGHISVFIRSHYEDVLVQRVNKWIDEDKAAFRMKAINNFEELLQKDSDTVIVKFYMHLSKDRQLEKLEERLNEPEKYWKHNDGDWETRKQWDAYISAYEDVLNKCAEPAWRIVPADQNWYRNYFIIKEVVEVLEKLNLQYPPLETELKR